MIFMSQSGLTDPSQNAQWNVWYLEHLRIMRTVQGIESAERFVTDCPNWPPSLAMYSVASAEVFQDPYYQKIRGMGPWLELIDKKFYRRNLFCGLDLAPVLAADELLLVSDQQLPQISQTRTTVEFTWLESVGLDQSTPFRGISVIKASFAQQIIEQAAPGWDIALYRPVAAQP